MVHGIDGVLRHRSCIGPVRGIEPPSGVSPVCDFVLPAMQGLFCAVQAGETEVATYSGDDHVSVSRPPSSNRVFIVIAIMEVHAVPSP